MMPLGTRVLAKKTVSALTVQFLSFCRQLIMVTQSGKTKRRILEAACALFAERGFKPVTTRMVAEATGVRHGTVHYHFKSKKDLYVAVFRQIFSFDNALTYDVLLEREPIVFQSPSGKAYAIYRIVSDFFHRFLDLNSRWERRLILRELFEHSPVFHTILEEIFMAESNKMKEFYHLLVPDATDVDAHLWAHLPDAQLLSHMTQESILESFHNQVFVDELKHKVAKITARSMISLIDLPIPDILK